MAYYGSGSGYGYGYSGPKRRLNHTWPAATAQPAPELDSETPIYPVTVKMVGTVTTVNASRKHGSGGASKRNVYIVNTSHEAWSDGLKDTFANGGLLPPSSIVRACCVFTTDWHFGPGPKQAFENAAQVRVGDVISVSGVVAAPFKPEKKPHGSALIQLTVLTMEFVRGLNPIQQTATQLALDLYKKCKDNGIDVGDVEDVDILRNAVHEAPAPTDDTNPRPRQAPRIDAAERVTSASQLDDRADDEDSDEESDDEESDDEEQSEGEEHDDDEEEWDER